MNLLANITKLAIDKKYILYNDLYIYDEEQLFEILKSIKDSELQRLLYIFGNIKKDDIPSIELPYIKKRIINPLVNNTRFS